MARKIRRHRPTPQMAEALRQMRAVSGMEREAFFKNGGDLKQWRPRKMVARDRKRHENKNRCRKKVRV